MMAGPDEDPSPGAPSADLATEPGARDRRTRWLQSTANRKRVVGIVLALLIFGVFASLNRFPKLDTVRDDVAIASADEGECFQGFCPEGADERPLLDRWWDFGWTYMRLVLIGMVFAFLMAGLVETFLFPEGSAAWFRGGGLKGSLRGLTVGPAMTLCSACIVPVSDSFRKKGASVESTVAITQGSSTLNIPALVMAALLLPAVLSVSRILVSIVGVVALGGLVARAVRPTRAVVDVPAGGDSPELDLPLGDLTCEVEDEPESWGQILREGLPAWGRSTLRYTMRLAPIMVAAGFISALAIQWLSPDTVEQYLGNHYLGVVLAATLGVLINVPLLFEIPLVVALLLLGAGEAPAAALLFTAAAAGPITYWGLRGALRTRGIAAYAIGVWVLGAGMGIALLLARDLVR